LIQEIFNLPNPKGGFNIYLFDDPILLGAGFTFPSTVDRHDFMWMWHHTQPDLAANLQYVCSFVNWPFPWKHLAQTQKGMYGICDVASLHRLWKRLPAQMKRDGIWRGYAEHILRFRRALENAELRGVPVDEEKRKELDIEIGTARIETFRQIQEIVPREVKGFHPAGGYKVLPKVVKELELQWSPEASGNIGWRGMALKVITEKLGSPIVPGDKKKRPAEWAIEPFTEMHKITLAETTHWRLCIRKPFLPGSPEQLKAYMRFRGHTIPKNFKEQKETTEKKELERHAKKYNDKLYSKVIEHREYDKLYETYVIGWTPVLHVGDARWGRLHSQFTFRPATGQLSSIRPNIQNGPKHSTLAKKWREMIAAPPGYMLVELDFCLVPETKVLCHDFVWRQVCDLTIGQEIVGFDEQRPAGKYGRRRLKKSVVEATKIIHKRRLKVTTDRGGVICSDNHMWLGRTNKTGHVKWLAAADLKPGMEICYFTPPWNTRTDYEAGWMAGFLDGEGSANNARIGFGQNDGPLWERAKAILEAEGFGLSRETRNDKMHNCDISGFPYCGLRVAGVFGPVRLKSKLQETYQGMATWGKSTKNAQVLEIEDLGVGPVVALQTSTRTLIADGYMSHNSAFHVLTTGFEAGDELYMRLARIDPHSFIASYFKDVDFPPINPNWSDDDIAQATAEVKKRFPHHRNKKAKPGILGYGFGLGINNFYAQNREQFTGLAQVRELFDILNNLFPKAKKWRDAIRVKAHNDGRLISKHGAARSFTEVFVWDSKRRCLVPGEHSEQAIAYLPANDAFGHLKDASNNLEDAGLNERYGWFNNMHDALQFCCREELAEECLWAVAKEMIKPSTVLISKEVPDGLWCGVEAEMGPNLAKMKMFLKTTHKGELVRV
jgi:hypothetical protein